MPAFPELENPSYTPTFGVPFEYLWDTYSEQFVDRATNSVVDIRVAWADASDFLFDVLGTTQPPFGGTPYYNRLLPLPHPEIENLYCTSAVLVDRPASSPSGANQPGLFDNAITKFFSTDWCKYRLTFNRLPYILVDDATVAGEAIPEAFRYLIPQERPRAREFTINSFTLQKEGDADSVIPVSAFVMDREQDLALAMLQVPADSYPSTAIDNCLGRINASDIVLPVSYSLDLGTYTVRTYAAQTLLFRGVATDITSYWRADGKLYKDVPFVFTYRPVGWRKLPNPAGDGAPVTVVFRNITPTKYLYDTADFSTMFKPGP